MFIWLKSHIYDLSKVEKMEYLSKKRSVALVYTDKRILLCYI